MLRDLNLQPVYDSDECNVALDFYTPVMKQAVSFDRVSGYFSSKAFAFYSEGLEYLDRNSAKYRLIISKEISEYDYEQIKKGYSLRKTVVDEMIESLNENLSLREEQRLSNLAYYIAIGVVDIKIAFKVGGIFHTKFGIVKDASGDIICFHGSNNETAAAINDNSETLQLTCSWLDNNGFYLRGIQKSIDYFNSLWNNQKDNLIVLPAEKVIVKEIMKHNKGRVIVEEVLLEKDAVVLDYDGQLLLQFNTDSIDWFIDKTFFKMRLRHKVEKIENNIIYFKTELSYPDFIKISELLAKRIPELGYKYHETERLLEYIKARNIYISERSRLGIELKTDNTKLMERYCLFKDIVDAHMERKLRDKQMLDAFFMLAMTKSANFSVPGSGKTSSALAVYCYLKQKGLVDRVVMIGPKNAFGSWIDEFKACFGQMDPLVCFDVQDPQYRNHSSLKKTALKYDTGNCNLFLFNYESLFSLCNEVEHLVSTRTLLVFDEVHKVKAIDGQRASCALQIAQYASYIIAMTGTPIPNSYLDIYNLLHLLYNDEYKDFFNFDISMLRNPSPTDILFINDKIQPFFCRTTKKELQVPDANPDLIYKETTSTEEQEMFEVLCKKYRSNKLALLIRILQLESNPRMLLNAIDIEEFKRVLDIDDSGDEALVDIVDYSSSVMRLIESVDLTTKKQQCINTVKSLVKQGKKVVVWCIFIDSIKSITKELIDNGISAHFVIGEVELSQREKLLSSFKSGGFDVLVTNPHTLAESVSLHTICHDAVYFEYSYNLVHLLQSKDRIHRLGLPADQYTQYHFLQSNFLKNGEVFSLDEQIYNRLLEKETVMLKAIDENQLEPVYTSDEDLDKIFGPLGI